MGLALLTWATIWKPSSNVHATTFLHFKIWIIVLCCSHTVILFHSSYITPCCQMLCCLFCFFYFMLYLNWQQWHVMVSKEGPSSGISYFTCVTQDERLHRKPVAKWEMGPTKCLLNDAHEHVSKIRTLHKLLCTYIMLSHVHVMQLHKQQVCV